MYPAHFKKGQREIFVEFLVWCRRLLVVYVSHTVENFFSGAAVTRGCSALLQKFQSCLFLLPGRPEEKVV
jgi:hypothetical protein